MFIFAASYKSNGGQSRLYATGFFYARLQTICGSEPPCRALMRRLPLDGVRQRERRNRFIIPPNKQLFAMSYAIQNCLNANNSTVPATSAHETCEKFIAFICERYPQIQYLHFKITKNGRLLTIRAAYHRRRIFAYGRNFELTISYFMKQCIRKMTLDKYYPSVAEAKEMKLLEPFFVKFQCEVCKK